MLSYLFPLLCILPLGVYGLADFHSTYVEDLLILVAFIYLWLRFLNRERIQLSLVVQAILSFIFASLLYSVGWFGFLRGYLDLYGRGAAFFPALLMGALFWRPPHHEPPPVYRLLLLLNLFVTVGVIGMALLVRIAATETVRLTAGFSLDAVMPYLMVLPVIGAAALLSPSLPSLQERKPLLIWCACFTFAASLLWIDNYRTWRHWYDAGELERGWTPFQYQDLVQIAKVQRRPYLAAFEYRRTYDRILHKGEVPRYLNWPFFLRYRMAYQGMRKDDPPFCAQSLPPLEIGSLEKIPWLKKIWHIEFVQEIPGHEPDYTPEGRVFVDFELDPDGTLYALDCWGRVYSKRQYGFLYREYNPDTDFNDAVDLEWVGSTFAYIRANGDIHSPVPLPIAIDESQRPSTSGKVVDFEWLQSGKTVLITTTHGEMYSFGAPLPEFPDWQKMRFYEPLIADVEVSPTEQGYYLLDVYGAIHTHFIEGQKPLAHTSPPIERKRIPYWLGLKMAVDLELDSTGRELYIYNRLGEVHTVALNPHRGSYYPPRKYPQRGVCIKSLDDGTLMAFESNSAAVAIPDGTEHTPLPTFNP